MPGSTKPAKTKAPRNRTIEVTPDEAKRLKRGLLFGVDGKDVEIKNTVICGDSFEVLKKLPAASFDLLFADPPYNLTKSFGKEAFRELTSDEYEAWLDSWLILCLPLLKPTASIYICGDWRSSSAIQRVGSKYFKLHSRITWERA